MVYSSSPSSVLLVKDALRMLGSSSPWPSDVKLCNSKCFLCPARILTHPLFLCLWMCSLWAFPGNETPCCGLLYAELPHVDLESRVSCGVVGTSRWPWMSHHVDPPLISGWTCGVSSVLCHPVSSLAGGSWVGLTESNSSFISPMGTVAMGPPSSHVSSVESAVHPCYG